MRTEKNQLRNVLIRSDDAYYKQLKKLAVDQDMPVADLLRKATDMLIVALERERIKAE